MEGLTNEEKLFVLYTKGHFSKYKDAKEVILGEVFDLHPNQIHEGIAQSFMIDLFTKLVELNSIEMNYEKPIKWLLHEWLGVNLLTPKSLHDWLYSKIRFSNPEGLGLDDVDRSIEEKMTLKDSNSDGWLMYDFMKSQTVKDLLDELEKRGYDTQTLKISIKKKI